MSIEQKDKEQMEQLIASEKYNEKHEIFFNDDEAKSQIFSHRFAGFTRRI